MVVLKRSPAAAAPSERRLSGLAHALGCFSIWGLFPIYFKLLEQVAPLEVLMHRILWSVLLLLALLLGRGQGPVLLAAFRDRRRLRFYLMTGTLISANWLLYIWAVQNNRILEASLGYYINPLVNIVLGVVVLQERLNPRQWSAVAIAAAGVLVMVIGQGVFPWVALALALSFGGYGLLRKKDGRSAMLGLGVETALLAPVAVLVLGALAASGAGAFGARDRTTDLLLLAAGPVTVVPLVLFLEAGRRLPLSTLGLIQYLTPTLQFLLGVWLYREVFSAVHWATFGCIWLALALYSVDAYRLQSRRTA